MSEPFISAAWWSSVIVASFLGSVVWSLAGLLASHWFDRFIQHRRDGA